MFSDANLEKNPAIQNVISANVENIQVKSKFLVPLTAYGQTPSEKNAIIFANLYSAIESQRIFRMKIWNKDFTVVWSNLPELINKRFPTNDAVKEAFEGNVESEYVINQQGEVETDELKTESLYSDFVETYVPIKDGSNKVVGIVEVYQTFENEVAQMKSDFTRFAVIFVGISVVIALGILFGLRAIKR